MTSEQADTMLSLLVQLFPLKDGPSLTDAEARLFLSMIRSYQVELVRAAIEGYKLSTKRVKPVLGELRAKLMAMAEPLSADGSCARHEAERAQWARWHAESERDAEASRVWIGRFTDAEIVTMAEAAIAKTGIFLVSVFGPEDPKKRNHTKSDRAGHQIDVARIRTNAGARGMLKAMATDQS